MPMPIPLGKQITVQYNLYPSNYCMKAMEISEDHYDINYIIRGDRKAIMPTQSYSYHAGNVSMGVPYMYHRTVSESDVPYERYLIKFTYKFVENFICYVGKDIFDKLCEQRLFYFSDKVQVKIERMFCEMFEEYKKDMAYKEFILQGMLYRLLTYIWENKLNVSIDKRSSPLTKSILDAIYYIENNYGKKLMLENIAKEASLSVSHFSRLFNIQLGMSVMEYISNVRIEHAKKQLIGTKKSIMEIALDVGYCNGDYLSYQFKAKTGMTPTEFRRNSKKG